MALDQHISADQIFIQQTHVPEVNTTFHLIPVLANQSFVPGANPRSWARPSSRSGVHRESGNHTASPITPSTQKVASLMIRNYSLWRWAFQGRVGNLGEITFDSHFSPMAGSVWYRRIRSRTWGTDRSIDQHFISCSQTARGRKSQHRTPII